MPMHGAVSARSSYKSALVDLCNALAEIARVRHLCMSTINPQSLSAFVACRLIIPLKKKIQECVQLALMKCHGIYCNREVNSQSCWQRRVWWKDEGSQICCIHSTCVFNNRRIGERENCRIRTLSWAYCTKVKIKIIWYISCMNMVHFIICLNTIIAVMTIGGCSCSAANRIRDANIELGYCKGCLGVFYYNHMYTEGGKGFMRDAW